jgi:hypothetical protein
VCLTRAQGQPVDIPIVERPFEHEAVQYGYKPWYVCNVPAFDSHNRPYIRSRTASVDETGYIHTIRNGRWVRRDFTGTVREAYPDFVRFRYCGGIIGAPIVFDAEDRLYTLLRLKMKDDSLRDVLLYSSDYGETFEVYELPFGPRVEGSSPGAFNIEQRVGFNTLSRPPLLTVLDKRADHPLGQWTHHYNMYLIQPKVTDQGLVLGEPVLVTDHALYMSRHSGNPSFAVSADTKTFFVYAETTDTDYVPGVPTYIAAFDPVKNEVTDRIHIGYGYPPNDGHNSPGIVRDSKGYLHTLTGSHGEDFFYSRSVEPDTLTAGMTKPVPSLETGWAQHGTERGRQCYLSFVCSADDSLHTVFRQWIMGTQPWFKETHFGALSHHTKSPGMPWDAHTQILVVPPVDGYVIHDQNLAIDRRGRLFVSYSYRSDQGLYYDSMPGYYHFKAVLMSPDGGKNWRLATTDDFVAGFDSAVSQDAKIHPARLVVRVTDAQGEPIEGAEVTAGPVAGATDRAGGFVFDGIEAEQFEVGVTKAGYEDLLVPVDLVGADSHAITMTLEPVSAETRPTDGEPR